MYQVNPITVDACFLESMWINRGFVTGVSQGLVDRHRYVGSDKYMEGREFPTKFSNRWDLKQRSFPLPSQGDVPAFLALFGMFIISV